MCKSGGYIVLDISILSHNLQNFTYISDAHGCTLWLNLIVFNGKGKLCSENISIEHSVHGSDHIPVSLRVSVYNLGKFNDKINDATANSLRNDGIV